MIVIVESSIEFIGKMHPMRGGSSAAARVFKKNKAQKARQKHARMNANATTWPIEKGLQLRLTNGKVERFGYGDIYNGKFWDRVASMNDTMASNIKHQIKRFYQKDRIGDLFETPWERPPIENVFCAYGVNKETPIGARFKRGPYENDWDVEDAYKEFGTTVKNRPS